jgi:tryptophanyl-tRNA synthetase
VEGNMVFHYLDAFYHDEEHLEQLKSEYRKGGLGDVHLKGILFKTLEDFLNPIREKRANFSPDQVREILSAGTQKATSIADTTLNKIKTSIGTYSIK